MRRAAIPRLRALGAPLRGLHAWLWLTPLNGQPPGPFFPRANACHGQSWCLCAAQALRPTPTRPTPPLRAQFAALIHTGSAEWLVPIKRNSDFDTTTPFASVEEACAHVARLRRAAGGAPLPSGPTAAGLLSAERLGRWRREAGAEAAALAAAARAASSALASSAEAQARAPPALLRLPRRQAARSTAAARLGRVRAERVSRRHLRPLRPGLGSGAGGLLRCPLCLSWSSVSAEPATQVASAASYMPGQQQLTPPCKANRSWRRCGRPRTRRPPRAARCARRPPRSSQSSWRRPAAWAPRRGPRARPTRATLSRTGSWTRRAARAPTTRPRACRSAPLRAPLAAVPGWLAVCGLGAGRP